MSHCVSRIGGELALIGFVFPRPVGTVFPVKLCCEEGSVEFGVERIGFVLRNECLTAWQTGTDRGFGLDAGYWILDSFGVRVDEDT